MVRRFSLFKLALGSALIYYGLKTLHLLPLGYTTFVDSLIGGVLGNIWGIVLLFLGIATIARSLSSNYMNFRCYKSCCAFTDTEKCEDKFK